VPSLTAAALRTQLNAGEPGPLYLLLGEDDAEKAAVAGEFTDLVDPGLQAFNVDRLYGGETSVDALLDAANTFPMMASRRVVLVLEAERLLRNGRNVRLQPQPFRLLCLLAGQAGRVVTREEIRAALWTSDTFVDFEQGVNFAIKQVREALGEDADHPVYIQTVPRRGYRFVAPVDASPDDDSPPPGTDLNLHKALWTNIADLKLAEERREARHRTTMKALIAVLSLAVAIAAVYLLRLFLH